MNKTLKHSILQTLFLFGMLCASLSFSACSDDDGDNGDNNNNGNNNNGGGGETATLSISPVTTDISFSVDATESYAYTVTTNQTSWDAKVTTADATWCKVEKTADGKGFTVTANANLKETKQRRASVVVSAKGAKSIVISVIQAEYKPSVAHIAGIGTEGEISYYVYWKDGVMQKLGSGITDGAVSGPSTMCVSGDDVYILGADLGEACYWKNGKKTILKEATAKRTCSIAVDGDDVYVAGQSSEGGGVFGAYYLKNGVKTQLPAGTSSTVYPSAMAVHNGDIYVIGQERIIGKDGTHACYWKNGVKISLDTDDAISSSTIAIAFSETDVYILGRYGYSSCYWKNGERVLIGNTEPPSSYASSIVVYGGDIYIGGRETDLTTFKTRACYWKNGIQTYLSDDLTKDSDVTAISVYGKTVHCIGSDNKIACYWKDLTRSYFQPNSSISLSFAYSIFVK